MTVSNKPDGNTLWSGRMIHTILTNPMYTGDLVQGRFRVKSYKVHQIETVPEEEWVRVADTHEAIIDKATFEVRNAGFQDTGASPRAHRPPVRQFLKWRRLCSQSRPPAVPARTTCITPALPIRAVQEMPAQCTLSVMPGWRPPCCTPSGSRCILLSPIQKSSPKSIQPLSKKNQSFRLDDTIHAKERELAKVTRYKQSLYQDWKDGEITQQEYRDMKATMTPNPNVDVLARLTAERAELANGVDKEHPALVAFKKYQNISTCPVSC